MGADDQIIEFDSSAGLRASGAGHRRVECCGRISPIRSRLMQQQRIRPNTRPTAGDAAAATGLERLSLVELIAGSALLASGAAVAA